MAPSTESVTTRVNSLVSFIFSAEKLIPFTVSKTIAVVAFSLISISAVAVFSALSTRKLLTVDTYSGFVLLFMVTLSAALAVTSVSLYPASSIFQRPYEKPAEFSVLPERPLVGV